LCQYEYNISNGQKIVSNIYNNIIIDTTSSACGQTKQKTQQQNKMMSNEPQKMGVNLSYHTMPAVPVSYITPAMLLI
jgi:hypothetical protein